MSSRFSSRADGQSGSRLRVERNLAVGWSSIAIGAVTGLILSLWSFDGPVPVPEGIGAYDALSRRLMRLGHIAFFGLGILNIMLARHVASYRLEPPIARLALASMNLGNILLPPILIAASFFTPLKYAASVPAMAVVIALTIGAYAAVSAAVEAEDGK